MLHKYSAYCCWWVVVVQCILSGAGGDPIVEIENGLIRGREDSTVGLGIKYYAFQSIPYAEPPIGSLRFSPPVAKSNWDGILNTTQDGNVCVQGSDPIVGNEDCLIINVYTPDLTPETLLPTLVYIHGGGFTGGDAQYTHAAPDYLLEKGVVFVSLQYRVGIFGFLTTGDLVAPGNYGLKDQVLALQWIQANIAIFGGNPASVTLWGQSAGAASVAYHLTSPLSVGLFHRTILDSGSSLCSWSYSRQAAAASRSAANNYLPINLPNSASQVAELRTLSAEDLQSRANDISNIALFTSNPLSGGIFGPVIEPVFSGAVVTQKTHQKLSSGNFVKVKTLLGFNTVEGAYLFTPELRLIFLQYDVNSSGLAPASLNIQNSIIRLLVGLSVKHKYFGTALVALSNETMIDFIGDDQFVRPIRELTRLIAQYSSTYLYRFSYQGGLWPGNNGLFNGTTHTEELGYIFRSPLPASPEDELTRQRLTTAWTNFAKYGNPTPTVDPLFQNEQWPTVDSNYRFWDIGDNLVTSTNPRGTYMAFWDTIFANSGNPPYTTY